jgi:hypothetical protein
VSHFEYYLLDMLPPLLEVVGACVSHATIGMLPGRDEEISSLHSDKEARTRRQKSDAS